MPPISRGPDFQTFNFRNISFGRQSQNYFFTVNKFSLGYAWTPRFSTVSSYTLGYTNYTDDVVSTFQDRFEHTFGNEFRFLVAPTTTLIAEYRFGIVDYTKIAPAILHRITSSAVSITALARASMSRCVPVWRFAVMTT